MKYTLIPGQPHAASEEETMSMIRSVLVEVPDAQEAKPSAAAAKLVAGDADKVAVTTISEDDRPAPEAFVDRTLDQAPRRRVSDLPDLAAPEKAPKGPGLLNRAASVMARPARAAFQSARGFQPTTRHLALASAALLCVVRPHWFVIGAVLIIAVVVGAFLTLGSDRIWHTVLGRLERIKQRDPARAAELTMKLDSFACRWDSVLDLFPEGMVDSLYMPDFQSMLQADIDHQAVVADRLSRMAQEG